MNNRYTKAHVGCYLDGSRGIYILEAVIGFAGDHGAKLPHVDCDCGGDSWSAECEWVIEVADEATDFMNYTFPVDGAYWGFQDGDWGLWIEEDTEGV